MQFFASKKTLPLNIGDAGFLCRSAISYAWSGMFPAADIESENLTEAGNEYDGMGENTSAGRLYLDSRGISGCLSHPTG